MIHAGTNGVAMGTVGQARPVGRYWLGVYSGGHVDGLPGEESKLFRTPEAAVKHWLAATWRLESDPVCAREVAAGYSLAEGLLDETALVVDVKTRRSVRVIAFRGESPSDSRLPVAVVFNTVTGRIDDEQSIEQWESNRSRQRRGLACVR